MQQVQHKGQHPLRHRAQEVNYINPTIGPGIRTVKDGLDYLVSFGSSLTWKDPVATKAALPLSGNTLGDARIVQDDGDGEPALYVCVAIAGDVDYQWQKLADTDWGNIWVRDKALGEITLANIADSVGIGNNTPRRQLDVTKEIMVGKFSVSYRQTDLPIKVVFQSSGNHESNYTVVKPLFDTKGITGNVGVITNQVGTGGNLSWSQIIALEAAGWEILSGAKTNVDLTGLSDVQLLDEVKGSKEALEAQGFTVESFVNPGHYTDENVRSVIKDYYRSARSEIKLGYNPTPIQTYDLSAGLLNDPADLQDWKDIVDAALAQEHSMIIFYYQDVDASLSTAMGLLIDYIQGLSIDIINTKEALDIYENVFEAGDLPNGRGFAVATNGDTRIGNFGVLQKVEIWDENFPYTNKVSIEYVNGDLKLCPDDHGAASKEVIIGSNADALRPESRRNINLGIETIEWANVWATNLNAQDGAGSVPNVNIKSFNGTDTLVGKLNFYKSRTSSIGTKATTVDNELLGEINASGVNANGTLAYDVGASIGFIQNGIAGVDYIGADIVFYTKTNADSNKVARAVINNEGNIGLGLALNTEIKATLVVNGSQSIKRTDAGAANYDPSALTTDYLIIADNTISPRNIIISSEDVARGTTANPRIFIIKDEYGNASSNPLTITLENGGTIDGQPNYTINGDSDDITIYITGTDGFTIHN